MFQIPICSEFLNERSREGPFGDIRLRDSSNDNNKLFAI